MAFALGCAPAATPPAVEIGPTSDSATAPVASVRSPDLDRTAFEPPPQTMAPNSRVGPARVEAVRALVPILGTSADPHPLDSVEALHSAGVAAVPLLIEELGIVDPEAFDDRAWHMIWCIRALRSLTGEDFEFVTKLSLSPRSASFFDARKPLPYFAEWMSHARVYVAPRDVQRKVIDAWKAWFRANGASLAVGPYEPPGDWYF